MKITITIAKSEIKEYEITKGNNNKLEIREYEITKENDNNNKSEIKEHNVTKEKQNKHTFDDFKTKENMKRNVKT